MKNKEVIPVTKKDREKIRLQMLNITAWVPYFTWNKKDRENVKKS